MARMQTTTPETGDGVAAADTPSATRPRPYGINRWTLLGRMTGDPQVRYTESGKAVLNLGVATTSAGYTHFHDLVAWERTAEILAQYGRKGREVYLEGRLQPRMRELEGGQRVKQVDLVVENFQLIGSGTSTTPATDEA